MPANLFATGPAGLVRLSPRESQEASRRAKRERERLLRAVDIYIYVYTSIDKH